MRPRSGLGRGLSALIPEELLVPDDPPVQPGERLVQLPLDAIDPNPEQPRTTFDPEALAALAHSIRLHGVLSPVVVRPAGEDGRYVLVAGERRLRAAGQAGLTEIPARVLPASEEVAQDLEIALVENLQREDLNPIEAARGYQRLVEKYGYTQEQVARRVGKDRATVANALRLLKLPDHVLDLVRAGRLSAGHARALVPVTDPQVLREIVSQVLARDLSVRATERLVRSRVQVGRQVRQRERRKNLLEVASRALSRHLSTQVEVVAKARGKGGRIVISYYDDEDLDRLLRRLKGDG